MGALAGKCVARVPTASARAGLSPGFPDEASMEPESEDEAGGAQGSVVGTGQLRASTASTTAHVCWCRQTSVSRADHSAAGEVRPSAGAPALLPPCSSVQPAVSGPWAPPEQVGARPGSEQAAGQLAGTHRTGGGLGAPLPSVPAPGSGVWGPSLRRCLCCPWAQAWGRTRDAQRDGVPVGAQWAPQQGTQASRPQPAGGRRCGRPVEPQPSSGASAHSHVCPGTLGTRSAGLVQPLPAHWTVKDSGRARGGAQSSLGAALRGWWSRDTCPQAFLFRTSFLDTC